MKEKKLNDIKEWVEKIQNEKTTVPGVCAYHNTFGFVETYNGAKAQVKVTLELDPDEWEKDW